MMDWIERALLAFCAFSAALTWIAVAITLVRLMSRSALPPLPHDSGSETRSDPDEEPRVWADDVLAEDEMATRKTQGAAAHSFDVCTFWDEEDERQANSERAARIHRSHRRR